MSRKTWARGLLGGLLGVLFGAEVAAAPEVTATPFAPVEASPVLDASFGYPQAIASDGASWLVAYTEDRPGRMMLRHVGADGVPIGPPQPLAPQVFGLVQNASLTFDGSSYLLLWQNDSELGVKWHLQRLATDGTPGQMLDAFAGIYPITHVAMAAGEQATLAVICGNGCETRLIGSQGITPGVSFPESLSPPSVAYFDGNWLVALPTSDGIQVTQLDGTGSMVDGTQRLLGKPGATGSSVAAAKSGFAVAWAENGALHTAAVDVDGAVGPVHDVQPPVGQQFFRARLNAQQGKLYLFASCIACASERLQRLNDQLQPQGEMLTDYPAEASFAAASTASAFGLAQTDRMALQGRLVDFGDSITTGASQPLSVSPRSQVELVGAAAPEGWLVAWKEPPFDWTKPAAVMAAPLSRAGLPSAAPVKLSEFAWNDHVIDLARGPSGWLISTSESGRARLQFLGDGAAAPTNVTSNSAPWLVLASSPNGWAAAGTSTDNAVRLTRVDKTGQLQDEVTVLAASSSPVAGVGVDVDGTDYVAWWTDFKGNGAFVRIPTQGPVANAPPPPQALPSAFYFWRFSAGAWWGLSNTQLSEDGQAQSLDQSFQDIGDMSAIPGAALLVAPLHPLGAEEALAGALGIVEPGGVVTKVAGVEPLFDARFSHPSGNQVLMLAGTGSVPYNRSTYRRAMVSLVAVGTIRAAGGDGGDGGGGDGGDGGGSADSGHAGATDGLGGEPAISPASGNGGQSSGDPEASNEAGEPSELGPTGSNNAADPAGSHTSKGCGCRTAGSNSFPEGALGWLLITSGAVSLRRRRWLRLNAVQARSRAVNTQTPLT